MALEELGLEVAVKGFSQFLSQMKRMDQSIGLTGDSWEKMGRKASPITGILTTVGKVGIGAVITAATAAITAVGALGIGMVKLGVDGLKMAVDFQSQMATLQIAAASTGLTYDELHDTALQVGGDVRLLGVSATGAADSMTGLYKAGLTTTEIFGDLNAYMNEGAELGGALRASIDLAAATELDMVQASELAAVALASFGGEMETEEERAKFITYALDNMVRAADASVAEVSGLAEALKMVGPSASAMGIPIGTVNNALALLSTRGIEGSMAGTSLNRMLLDLGKTTPKAATMMEKLGVNIYDADGAMRPLVEIIGQFEAALGDATDAERDAALQAIFTAQGARAMNVLLKEGVEGWNTMGEAIEDAMGIQEQAAIKAETYAGKMEALEGVMETVKIQIGEALLPVATDLLTWFSEMVDQYGPVLVSVFEKIGGALETFFGNLAQGHGLWIAFLSALGRAGFADLANQINVFVYETFLPAFAAIRDWFITYWPIIQAAAITAWTVIQEVIMSVVDVIVGQVWPTLQEAFAIMTEALAVLGLDWEDVWNAVKTAVGLVAAAIGAILLALVSVIAGIFNGIANMLHFLAQRWEAMAGAIKTITEGLAKVLTGNWEGILDMISGIVELIVEFIRAGFGGITAFIKGFIEGVIGFFKNLYDRLVGGSIVPEMMAAMLDIIKTGLEKIVSAIKGYVSQFREMGGNLIKAMKEGVISAVQGLIDAVRKAIQRAIDAAKSALGAYSPSRVFMRLGAETMQGYAAGIASLAPAVQAQVRAAITPTSGMAATSQFYDQRQYNYNLTTQSLTRPGGLRLEFAAMEMASR